MRVGLLGGSFDPVHYGHLRAAEWALDAFRLDAVRLMPARQSPFKGPSVASDADRLAMLTLAVEGNPLVGIESSELERESPSFTVDTLRALKQAEPHTAFALIVGSDAASGIAHWKDSEEVRRLAEVRVLRRPEDTTADALPSTDPGAQDPRDNAQSFEGLAVSSTQIRTLIQSGHSIRYLTPEPVRQYIEEKGLYK